MGTCISESQSYCGLHEKMCDSRLRNSTINKVLMVDHKDGERLFTKVFNDRRKVTTFKLKVIGWKEELFFEGCKTLGQVVQQSCAYPIVGRVQGQVVWRFEQPASEKCPHPWQGGWNQMVFKVPCSPNHSVVLWFFEMFPNAQLRLIFGVALLFFIGWWNPDYHLLENKKCIMLKIHKLFSVIRITLEFINSKKHKQQPELFWDKHIKFHIPLGCKIWLELYLCPSMYGTNFFFPCSFRIHFKWHLLNCSTAYGAFVSECLSTMS